MNEGLPDDSVFVAAQRGETHNSNVAHFYYYAVLNPQKTAEVGQEIYEDKEYVLIISPGQRLSEIRRKATDMDKLNYGQQYKAFLDKRPQPIVGTPLAMLPGLTPARVKELQYLNIRTVQHLVDMPDSALPKVGPDALQLRQRAVAFIEKNDPIIIALEQRVKDLELKLAALSSAPPQQQPAKRRGRPPKTKVNGTNDLSVHRPSRVP